MAEEKMPLSESEEKIFSLAKDDERGRRQEIDFADVYRDEEISRDMSFIEKNKRYERQKTSRAVILEYLLVKHMESSDWLGGSALVSRSCEYDDQINHVDAIIEFNATQEPLRLAVDITSSENDLGIEDKINQIKNEIAIGSLSTVKYFESQIDGSKGRLRRIPRVILALDNEQIQKLSEADQSLKKKEMVDRPEQLLLILEIKRQMMDQIRYGIGLIFQRLSDNYKLIDVPGKDELKKMIAAENYITGDAEKLLDFTDLLASSKHLMRGKFDTNWLMKGVVEQAKILRFFLQLEQEKNGSLKESILKEAAEMRQANAVLRQPAQDFDLPPVLAPLRPAA